MIVTLDPHICKKYKLQLVEALYIGSLYFELENKLDKEELNKNDFIRINADNSIQITAKGVSTFENILVESSKKASPKHKEILSEAASEMRTLFPPGFKADDYGNPKWPWRCSVAEATDRLVKLETLYSCEFTKEELINATKLYLKINSGNAMMRTFPYFIIKDGRSDLYTYIEMLKDQDSPEDVDIDDKAQYEIRFDE